MLLLPVRVEDAEVDRLPAVSIGIAAACAVAFLFTWVLPSNPDGFRTEGFHEIARYYQEHPYLELQPRFLYDYLSPRARESLEELREEQPVTVDAETLGIEQRHLDSLIEGFEAEAEGSLLRRLGLVPARGLLQPGWLTHMFLHFGWMHLLGNLFFFYLVGPLLEDLWGRRFFAGFYLVGGFTAGLAHFALDPRSAALMAGASGAIASCMGAFTYRCASRRIRMWYLIFLIRSGTFLIPAWLWGGFWFAGEVFGLVTQSSGGVAVMAHIGGFLFGFAAAVALEKSGYEARELAPAVQGKTTWTQHAGTDAARVALDRGDKLAAAQAFRSVVKDRPLDREAAVGLARIEQDPRGAVFLLHALANKGEIAQAWEIAVELGPLFDPDQLPDKLAYQLAGVSDPPEGAGDLPERLDAAVGARKGPLAPKALLRAARRCLAAGRTERAQEHLAAARALPGLAPEMRKEIDAVERPPRGAARAWAGPTSAVAPASARAPATTLASAAAPASAVRVLACKLVQLAEDALHVQLATGKTRRVEFDQLVGIAAGVVATAEGAAILTDFVLSWGSGADAPSAIRIPGAQLGLASLFPGLPAKQAYSKLMAYVLARIAGVPLPSRQALANGEYPKFPSVAALNAAFYGPRE
ncbi:MAG TPA: rhomboid family intramembrane serine protease [Myxococcales bacterium]|nr:rhomboid family intramembrane serine protease [Myxococcales bacterium]